MNIGQGRAKNGKGRLSGFFLLVDLGIKGGLFLPDDTGPCKVSFFLGKKLRECTSVVTNFMPSCREMHCFLHVLILLLINVRQQGDLLGRTLSTPRASHVGPSSSQER
ncbi:hypothetical protein FOYG_13841 [Fusarium oxysporum NRRL 32931]|uniref:Uncharacterized protein n=1 Tax=Fusarium oxysporum NRRL 32931 TaxID=660029 RepID=W9HSU9_FUSOX|nr:hypothetical protein FOYG_13841 [Fusarium oxysporum NRRL 32931]